MRNRLGSKCTPEKNGFHFESTSKRLAECERCAWVDWIARCVVMRWQAILGLASIVIGAPGCEVILGLEKGVYQECNIVDECGSTNAQGALVQSCTANVCIYDDVPANAPDTVTALAAGWFH